MTKTEKKHFYNYLVNSRDFAISQMEKSFENNDHELYCYFKGVADSYQSLLLRFSLYSKLHSIL